MRNPFVNCPVCGASVRWQGRRTVCRVCGALLAETPDFVLDASLSRRQRDISGHRVG